MNIITRAMKPNLTTTITVATETTISPAAAAGTYLDLYRLTVANSSATGVTVTIRAKTGAAAIQTYWVAAGAVVGFSGTSDDALPATEQNVLWTAQVSSAVSSVIINAEFKRNFA